MTVYRRPDPIPLRTRPIRSASAPLAPVRAAPDDLSRVVARRIFQAILDGHFAPGSILPNEHQLSADLGVSRTALREAIKGLSAKGLVETRRKRGTLVRERQQWNMLDADVVSWSRRNGFERVSSELWDAVRVVQPGMAAQAALRRSPGRLIAIARDLATAQSPQAKLSLYVQMLLEVAHLSRNRFLYSLTATALGNLEAEDDAVLNQYALKLSAEDVMALCGHIASGNQLAAEQTMRELIGDFAQAMA